jgi:hypothetical protein
LSKEKNNNILLYANPTLAREWHPTKNGLIAPINITYGSNKKVWWKCKRGHEWEEKINNRSHGRNCPYCSGHRVSDENNLEVVDPVLSKEWHRTKNDKLKPRNVTTGTQRKVWWMCKKGHEWEATVVSRHRGNGCPYCANQKVNKDNCLQTINPNLSKEWHRIKNGTLTPNDVTPGTSKKVWWICKKGHEWKAAIYSRSTGTGCPICKPQTSNHELRIYSELKYVFPDVNNRYKHGGIECDIFLHGHNIAIEYDGIYWHKNREEKDKKKNASLKKHNIILIRVRQKGLKRFSKYDIISKSYFITKNIIDSILIRIVKLRGLNEDETLKISKYLKSKQFLNDKLFYDLLSTLPFALPGKSLQDLYPQLSNEWHPINNGDLKPNQVYPNTNIDYWWKCKNGHEWQSRVNNRVNGNGCPFCTGRKASKEHSLFNNNPTLAKQWHPTNNLDITPKDVTPSSHKKVWWMCVKKHEWRATVKDRNNGNGCPYCAGKKISEENNLGAVNPDLTKEWNILRNKKLSPFTVTPNSNKKVWWICKKGHEWKAVISSRNRGSGCPYCANQLVNNDNCLQTVNPDLAIEWHPTKNLPLTPMNVTPGNSKKVWWICKKKHEWRAVISSRNSGIGCPYCAGKKASKDYSLLTVNPELAQEWHGTKNQPLKPSDFTPNSHKKVWWKCKNGHEWEAVIHNRNYGNGCPYCAKIRKNIKA